MENFGLVIMCKETAIFKDSTNFWLYSTEENFYSCLFYFIDNILYRLLSGCIDFLHRLKIEDENFELRLVRDKSEELPFKIPSIGKVERSGKLIESDCITRCKIKEFRIFENSFLIEGQLYKSWFHRTI